LTVALRQRRVSALAASVGIAALVLGSELILFLVRAHEDRLHLGTGKARWIWATRDLPEPAPLRFEAIQEFSLSRPEGGGRARVFVDRAYTLRVNGSLVGSGSRNPGDPLDEYDLSTLLRPGRNEIAIEASSPTGAGGILFWLDLEGGRSVVSDASWEIQAGPEGSKRRRAVVWGRPPMYPWGYPALPRRN